MTETKDRSIEKFAPGLLEHKFINAWRDLSSVHSLMLDQDAFGQIVLNSELLRNRLLPLFDGIITAVQAVLDRMQRERVL